MGVIDKLKSKVKDIALPVGIGALGVVFIMSTVISFVDTGSSSASSSSDWSGYTEAGAYIVKTDEDGALKPLTKDQLKTAIDEVYTSNQEAHDNYISCLDTFIEIQSEYKVNAAFAVATAQNESSGGTAWDLISADTYNWFSFTGTVGGGYVDRKGTSWDKYSSFNEATEYFGQYMTGSNYFGDGRYSVSDIMQKYDAGNASSDTEDIQSDLDKMYSAAGVEMDISNATTYTYKGKTYKLYSQKDYNDNFGGSRTIASAGCGATSLAIVISAWDSSINPSNLTSQCSHYGYTCDNNSVFNSWLGDFDLTGSFVNAKSSDAMSKIVEHLKSGMPVIYNIHGTLTLNDGESNDYSANGHFITLLGLDDDDNIFVGDPYGKDGYATQQNITNSLGSWGNYLLVKEK